MQKGWSLTQEREREKERERERERERVRERGIGGESDLQLYMLWEDGVAELSKKRLILVVCKRC